ncbi:hypothetical protein Q3A66_16745 [Hymenobacter sp. BT770]|uniref:hypothetical protein n=1 Tax=Hymenobacter sp. BT770 TaxID=2886942 RepID=UPI001D108461|nr:hypothetical protein [Hymenobacter sp. BT770]MCC3154665.1 hypothetical protein [Hymenobacter sp. BT770]MDO3416719.1 hypothetical protein [Hymenobacter sp. BT770]
MIVYGYRGSHLRTEPIPGVICPHCAAPEALQVSLYCRYAYVYWIPLFPFAKPAVAGCVRCRLTWEGKALPAEVRSSVRSTKKQTRLPLWNWTGTGLLLLALAWGAVDSTRDDRANAAYLAAPRAGDIYTVHENDSAPNYSLLKVVSARGNGVQVVANEFQIDNNHPIDALNAPAKYSKEPFTLTKFDLQIMKNKGQLTDVDRLEE